MNRPWRPAVLLLLASLLCSPLFAYQLALKDGRTVQFQRCRVESGRFFYTDEAGKEASVPISDVDVERTRALNAQESPPLDLSALAVPGAGDSAEPASLGDAARQLRSQGKAHEAGQKRSYTDDDVKPAAKPATAEAKAAATGVQGQKTDSKQDEGEELTEQDASEFYDLGREETGRAVLAYGKLPPDTPFPDRADWEVRMYEAKQEWVHAYMNIKEHPHDEAGLKLYDQKSREFDAVANDGIRRARLYLQAHPRSSEAASAHQPPF
jgi:hypothetical protein